MAESEVGILVVASVVALAGWAHWLVRSGPRPLVKPGSAPTIARLAPLTVPALLLPVLLAWSSWDVKASALYVGFYLVLGLAWVRLGLAGAGVALGTRLGLDVAERGNAAAATALAGAAAGLTLAFAGANVGDGPGWWVVVGCALLSTAGFLAAWMLVNALAPIHELLTVERDAASALRAAGLSIALGIVLGRAVAGDYVDVPSTIHDFLAVAWLAVVLALAEVVLSRRLRPHAQWPRPSPLMAGLVPAVAHVGLAALAVVLMERP